ncbi:hypothetical protein NMY22_g14848 [Coprinellus aureogranulatus]|nr:hypothetical protein NMY22_g14848 [Coprinellus aureogranulatus]
MRSFDAKLNITPEQPARSAFRLEVLIHHVPSETHEILLLHSPTYVPIPASPSAYSHPSFPDHETGSFSCTYSPQHSLGVARINLQSARINEPEGWRSWFKRRPSTWVKVKVLGRTNVVGSKEGKKGSKGRKAKEEEIAGTEMKTWREERDVGETDVCEKTYTPNFGFKSYHALLGPYEHQLEFEVHSKKRFAWLLPRGARSKLLATI